MLYFVALSPQSCSLSPNQKFISGLPKSKGLQHVYAECKCWFAKRKEVQHVYAECNWFAKSLQHVYAAIDLPKVYSMFMLKANVALQTACLSCKGVTGNHNILLRILYWLYVSSFVLRAICFFALCYECREAITFHVSKKVSKAKGADLSSCPKSVVKQTVFVVSDIVQCGLTHCPRTEIFTNQSLCLKV